MTDPREIRAANIGLFLLAGYALLVGGVLTATGRTHTLSLFQYSSLTLLTWGMALGLFVLGYVGHLAFVRRAPRPLQVILADLRTLKGDRSQWFLRLYPLLMLTLLMGCFSAFKMTIPELIPFRWDASLAALDRTLFGTDPWRLTHALFGTPAATALLQAAYALWFFVMWGGIILFTFKLSPGLLRARYLLAFMLTWIVLGSGMALLFSSAGPCFYGLLGLGDTYAPLMQRLEALNATRVLSLQNQLWNAYSHPGNMMGAGISAMPSLHVGIATLVACAAFQVGRGWGFVAASYALIIQIGSVHLGWHYAVDGLIAAPVTIALWHLAGVLVAAPCPKGAQPEQATGLSTSF